VAVSDSASTSSSDDDKGVAVHVDARGGVRRGDAVAVAVTNSIVSGAVTPV
jgi:hypothetical protein